MGDLSLYRTRQLVPSHRMEDLRRGEVMVSNWHRLAKEETNRVNGDSARVVRTGEAVQVVRHAGKANATIETRYVESDRAWLKRIRAELGNGRGHLLDWQQEQAGELHPVPPVFIEVCRDTRVARAVYDWLADGKGAAAAPPWFRNAPGQEVTVRIDSRVVEDMEAGGTQDETRRLRFILDTIGKKTWPGDKVPEEWAELVRRHNAKAEEEGPAAGAGSGLATGAGDGVGYRWLDERVPPGRDIRCIVSVAMLTEGWDANTVTHIVGLRLGLRIPYRKQGVPAHYYPDFIAVLTTGLTLLIEIKGRYADDADRKAKAAQRWVAAVNRCGEHGSWRYLVITEPPKLMLELDQLRGSTREAKGLVLG